MNLSIVSMLVFFINLPFGYWRAQVKKYSLLWFLFIHIPIPAVILLRIYFEVGFGFYTYPILIAAFFCGQYLGTKFKNSSTNN